jgi:hypothetical protein
LDVTTSHYFDTSPKLIGGKDNDVEFAKFMSEIGKKELENKDSTIVASVKVCKIQY